MRRALCCSALVLALLPMAKAQSTALRWIVGEVNRVYIHPGFGNYCMGGGVDRTFNDRLTIGFDISYDIANGFRAEGREVQFSYGGVDYTYAMFPRLLSLNYHTEFALADNDGTHTYIGTYIGIRDIMQKWQLRSAYYSGYYSNGNGTAQKGSKVLVPVGLRFGVRGPTNDGFMDLYFAFGYQIGGGNYVMDGTAFHPVTEYGKTSSLALTIGWAYGLGW
jgi:hypothetical protein